MSKIGVIGSGYVGIATALTFAIHGHEIVCGDIDEEKVRTINDGISPLKETGFEKIREYVQQGKIRATDNIAELARTSDYIFICVGTPMRDDGSIDLKYIEAVIEMIKPVLEQQILIIKSTVIPGTTRSLINYEKLCNNPEFLREGQALKDSLEPDRIIIGALSADVGKALAELYEPFDCTKVITSLETSEMIKYAGNAFLATKITFANEMANICEKFNVDVYEVMDGIKRDKRISPEFLDAGAGFGGSCFEKDLNALRYASIKQGYGPKLIDAVLEINEHQPLRVVQLLEGKMGDIKGRKVGLLGLAFKPDTDDVRSTRSEAIARALLKKGVELTLYDPLAMDNFKRLGFEDCRYAVCLEEALEGQEAIIIQTKWREFMELTPDILKKLMAQPVVIDGRRTLDPEEMIREGITYLGIGWKNRV